MLNTVDGDSVHVDTWEPWSVSLPLSMIMCCKPPLEKYVIVSSSQYTGNMLSVWFQGLAGEESSAPGYWCVHIP